MVASYADRMVGRVAWDVAVLGGGPAGLAAARAAASAGVRTVVLERAAYPRYKTCGGGLIGTSLAALPDAAMTAVCERVQAATFTLGGRYGFTRRVDGQPLLAMVRREDFDQKLAHLAEQSGAQIRPHATVRGLTQDADQVTIRLGDGQIIQAAYAIGADGSAGISSRHVGVRLDQIDLGLELELPVPAAVHRRWSARLLIDWGPLPGSYGWVFPKDGQLTVGVIAARGHGELTRRYLRGFLEQLGLSGIEPRQDSGHLTRCRCDDSPLGRGRVLLAGDAAGLLDPWTREGISFALRSGALAGVAAAAAIKADATAALATYQAAVEATLTPEMQAGRRLLAVFARRPGLVHAVLATPPGWQTFVRFCRGEANLTQAVQRRPVRALLRLMRA